MKLIDMMPEVSSDLIDNMSKGNELAQILLTAVRYDIFSLTIEPAAVGEVALKLNVAPDLTEKFLNVLTALKLLTKIGGKYCNSSHSELFLLKSSPFYQGNLIDLVINGYPGHPGCAPIDLQKINTGTGEDQRPFESVFTRSFILAMAEAAMRGTLQNTVYEISLLPEFKEAKKLLDLGGGHGLYALAFAQLNPHLDVTVFDLPEVVGITREFTEKHNLESQVKVIPGDFNNDDLGEGFDIIFASDVFYRQEEAVKNVLQKIFKGLNPGGLVILKHWFLNEDGTGPLETVLFDFKLSLRGNNHHIYTKPEFISLLEEAGFEHAFDKDISFSSKPSIILAGRKII